jgi:hypothetical protein
LAWRFLDAFTPFTTPRPFFLGPSAPRAQNIHKEAIYCLVHCKKWGHKCKKKKLVPSSSCGRWWRAWEGHSSRADMSFSDTIVLDRSTVPVSGLTFVLNQQWRFYCIT